MVFMSICEHASTALIFASTSNDQISHASSEHLKKLQMASTEHIINFYQLESLNCCFTPSYLAGTFKTRQ